MCYTDSMVTRKLARLAKIVDEMPMFEFYELKVEPPFSDVTAERFMPIMIVGYTPNVAGITHGGHAEVERH